MSSMIDATAQLISRGGIVMIPLIAISIIALALVIERSIFWIGVNRPGRVRRVMKLIRLIAARDERARRALLTDESLYGRVYREVVDNAASDAAALSALESQRPRMERFMTTLSTIITAAPLLGILGTVLGIIQSFRILGLDDASLTDPRGVSAGIAEALLTTALGLVIALATLFPYMIFRGQVDRTLNRLEALVAAAREGSGAAAASSAASAGGETRRSETRTKEGAAG